MGIDISKSKIDCILMNEKLEIVLECILQNNDAKIEAFIKKCLKKFKILAPELLVCCENTGIYNRPLERVSVAMKFKLWVEHAVKIKRASTDYRGKDDRKDAIRIAEYAIRYQDKQYLYTEPDSIIQKLNSLIKSRETILNQQIAIQNQLREAKSHDKFAFEVLYQSFKQVLKTYKSSLAKIEAEIEAMSNQHEAIKRNIELATSIPGVGVQTAINFIIVTNNFTLFKSAKHLACYAGVVPFKNESGTIKKKERVSKMANLKLKRLLHLSAMSSIRAKGDLKEYYIRKVKEGKNKMSVLNAVRNKITHRLMAVIERGQPYVVEYEVSYQKKENKICILP